MAAALACGDNGSGQTDGMNGTTGGVQTTGGATTGPATTSGAPTTGEPSTGGATTVVATTGDATTGSATTGSATTGDATTGDATTGSSGDASSSGGAAVCGDGVVAGDEACDDGGESMTCNADCTAAACGDGKLNAAAGEACDDGGESMTCNADCTAAACGDGQTNAAAGEACDAGGESDVCDADCTAVECGDGQINQSAGETCEGDAPENAECQACAVQCLPSFDDCNEDLVDGCEVDLSSDELHCGTCGNACPNNAPCNNGKCVQVGDAFHSYVSEGRTVYIFKSAKCADLGQHVNFCQNKGLSWWKAKSQPDAQLLITTAYNLDNWHTWIQVHGAVTTLGGTVDGFNVTVDSPGCVDASPDGWTAFRKWGCSFCEPAKNQNQSCCWDKDHAYDWFVCQT